MYRSTENFAPLHTVSIGGYLIEERDSDGTHYNLGRESDFRFHAIIEALRTVLCLPRAPNRYTPITLDELHTVLAGLRDDMSVEVELDLDFDISPTCVADLRQLTTLPPGLVVTVPQGRDKYPEDAVKLGTVR
jgi:hypothetical protein